MNYQKFISLLSNQNLQQEIEDNEKLQLEISQKIIDVIGVESWNNFSDYEFKSHSNKQVRRLKADDDRLCQIYVLLEEELDRRINASKS